VLYGSERSPAAQRRAFCDGRVPVAVYGLGKMGTPIAAVFADVSGNVTGVDVDPAVVEAVQNGRSPVENEPGLDDLVASTVARGALTAVTNPTAAAREAAIHVVVVPTLLDETDAPDLSVLDAAVAGVADGLSPGDFVIVESTVPPRTCVDRVEPALAGGSGLERGSFGVAFCPERTLSGRALRDIQGAYPKIVGGVDSESTRVAELVYEQVTSNDVVALSDATTAEAVKVFEGAYRDVNIALANELATFAREFDASIVEAIDAANTQPHCDIHTPGAGVGGHCIPYYSYFLVNGFESASPLLETARAVNEWMPDYTADQVLDAFVDLGVAANEASVLVLGLGYRPGVDEIRESPALRVIERLADGGVTVTACDPVVSEVEPFEDRGATIRSLERVRGGDYDAVVLVTDQDAFEDLAIPTLAPADRPLVVVDGRQALCDLQEDPDVVYRGVGVNA